MNIPKGLYEVITSDKITLKQKEDSIRMFAEPIYDLNDNTVEQPAICKEDAELIILALNQGGVRG